MSKVRNLQDDVASIMLDTDDIQRRIEELAQEISKDYQDKEQSANECCRE